FGIPERECEHAPQASERSLAPMHQRSEEHLRVATGPKNESGRLELRLQEAEIVYGTVENERVSAVLRLHRLVTVDRVEYRQAPHSNRRGAAGGRTGVVG